MTEDNREPQRVKLQERLRQIQSQVATLQKLSSPTTVISSSEMKKNEKSVRFSPVTRVNYVPHLSDFSDSELAASYHSPEDTRRIEAGMVRSIRAFRSGSIDEDGEERPEDDANGGGDTIRGLEHMTSASELRRRKALGEGAADAVLSEQSRQRLGGGGGVNEEALTKAYARTSVAARDLALELGAKDESYVRRCVMVPPPAITAGGARPSLTSQGSVSKNVLARLGAFGLNDSASSPGTTGREEAGPSRRRDEEFRCLSTVLSQALELNAPGTTTPPAPPSPLLQRLPCTSEGSSLWASLSGEAVTITASTAPPTLAPAPSADQSTPPKLAKDVLERISRTLQAEKCDALPVALPVMLQAGQQQQPSASSLRGMLAQTLG